MNKTDIMAMDGKLLSIFKTVLEEGSVTAAASRLDVSQSSISHSLDRLRALLGDPLFVRAGRSVAPTERALALAPQVTGILEQLESLRDGDDFDPQVMEARFVLSVNDYERELLAPQLVSELLKKAPRSQLKLIDTKGDVVDSLRKRECDVVVSPLAPINSYDLIAQNFFDDDFKCFFDPAVLSPRAVAKHYLEMRHIAVRYSLGEQSFIDEALRKKGWERDIVVQAPSLAALPRIMRGTELVATLPARAAQSLFEEFGTCPLPFPSPTISFHMIWHKTTQQSPMHRWFRNLLTQALKAQGV